MRILEAVKMGYDPDCPAESPYFFDNVRAMIADGRMILAGAGFADTQSFAQSERMMGRELSCIGWPTPDGSCGSVLRVSGISINAATDCIEGCWAFARYVMQSIYAYKPAFEKALSDAIADSESDFSLTRSQAQRYRDLMASVTVAVSDNGQISDIVLKEAAPMLAGDMSPEDAAKLIQAKLSIYVAEHS